jgi:RNA polymerase sigma-70 factor (ECF subfamily)
MDPVAAWEKSARLARGSDMPDGSVPSTSQRAASAPASRDQLLRSAWQQHRATLFRLGLRYGGGRREFAEDVLQESFLKLWARIDRLNDLDDVGGWLYRVCTNECLSRLRRESFRNSPLVTLLLGQTQPCAPSADVLAHVGAERADALEALALLAPRERVAFCMVHLDDKTLREVGEVIGLTPGAVHKLLARANERLVRAGWQTPARPPEAGGRP